MRKYALALVVSASMSLLLSCGTENSGNVSPELADILAPAKENPFAVIVDSAPDAGCERLITHGPKIPLGRAFNDLNEAHLSHARREGIKPIFDAASAWHNGAGLVEVHSDSTLFIDELTHSYPYLLPHAAGLLSEIGHRFHKLLQERGGGEYRIKVTSLLRTDATVGRLRRVNRNASSESAHRYATTFDISYSKFICDNSKGTARTFEDLKNLLAEVVDSLRSEGRCLVKREYRQACFHITAIDTEK